MSLKPLAAFASIAFALIAAPLAAGAFEPAPDAPSLDVPTSPVTATTARLADERPPGPKLYRSVHDSQLGAASRGVETRARIFARPEAAAAVASPLARWLLSHGTTTSLP